MSACRRERNDNPTERTRHPTAAVTKQEPQRDLQRTATSEQPGAIRSSDRPDGKRDQGVDSMPLEDGIRRREAGSAVVEGVQQDGGCAA